MTHTIQEKTKLLSRVRRIAGQVRALESQLEVEADHTEVMQQIAAIRGAVNGLMAVVIEGHLIEHVVKVDDGKQREKDLNVVLQVIKSYLR